MDQSAEKRLLISKYQKCLEAISQLGVHIIALPEESLQALPVSDIRVLVVRLEHILAMLSNQRR